MSIDTRFLGIWWDGQKGRAKHNEVDVRLRRAPVIGTLVVDRIEFDPALRVYLLAERACDPRRDMTPDEVDEANLWLLRMSSLVREVIG